jgi:hypothetical protein
MINLNNLTLPPVKIPSQVNLALHLLREEIKHQTLTNAFEKLGMDTTLYSTNLGAVVLALCGVEERPDELFEWYFARLDVYAQEYLNGDLLLPELAFDFYIDLLVKIKN